MANGFNHRSKSYQVEPENYYRLFALETNSIENIPQFPKEVIPEVLRNGFHADAVISSVPSEVVNYTTSSLTKEAVATVLNDSVAVSSWAPLWLPITTNFLLGDPFRGQDCRDRSTV